MDVGQAQPLYVASGHRPVASAPPLASFPGTAQILSVFLCWPSPSL